MYQLFLKAFYWAESQSYPVRKLFHFTAGLIISCMFSFINPVVGFFSGMAIGVGKEIHDAYSGGVFSIIDVLITSSGSLIGALLIWHYFFL